MKTASDPDAGKIDLMHIIASSVTELTAQPKPTALPSDSRLPAETVAYDLNAVLTTYKLDDNGDYEAVITAGGATMLVKLPDPACVSASSPLRDQIRAARAQFDARLTAGSSFKTANQLVTLTGVAFFDSPGQTGAAPNGIELHPVLSISFASGGPCGNPAAPTSTAYLPNVTKELGGRTGFQTPFIVQNTGSAATDLEVIFYRFVDGHIVTCKKVTGLGPGTSFAEIPNNDPDLPNNSQFSVVVKSFGSTVVAVVNEHAGSGERAEALSYNGFSSGAATVFLPNIVRRFFGFHTPLIIQNLGTAVTTITAAFVGRAGEPGATITRSIAPGQAQFIEPNVEPSLIDGGAYAVTVTATQPIAVVVNTHNDDPSVARPLAYSTDGITVGSSRIFGPYAAKNANDVGLTGTYSTIVVQNLGSAPVTPMLVFTPLGGGSPTTFTGPPTAAKAAWAFDPRFENGVAGATLCGVSASAGCLADGEYSFEGSAAGGSLAAAVNVFSPATAMGYMAAPQASTKFFLPNVTRTLGGSNGWTTPILIQSANATGGTIEWRRFSDGQHITTQNLTIAAGTGIRVDPRSVAQLSDDTQYAVTVTGIGGTVVAIVTELNFQGGDGAMTYEGFPGS
ncbi:MAG TPA: hypothetical protein VGR87_02095 [Candidatus Limnocylindria bacterium]|nr:hypothetical protein [Candidatus Limnocylindria bacterium]